MAAALVFTKLMDLPDDMLVRILRANPVSDDTLDLIPRVKAAHERFRVLMHTEMQLDREYRDAVQELFFLHHVRGTRIPCNAEHVPEMPQPDDMEDIVQLFESTKKASSAGLFVSGIFSDEFCYSINFWKDLEPPSEDLETDCPCESYYYLVVEFNFFPPAAPELDDGRVDLSQVPNVMRSVLLGDSTLDVDHARYEKMDGTTFTYRRVLRIREDHTMDDVIRAVCDVEGRTIKKTDNIGDEALFCNISVSNSGLFDVDELNAMPIPLLVAKINETEWAGDHDRCHVVFYWETKQGDWCIWPNESSLK